MEGSVVDVRGAPVVRDWAVDRVVALFETGIDMETGIELVRVSERLLEVADTVPLGPGTARMTVAGAAVYKQSRRMPQGLTPGLNPISRSTNH